MCKNMRLIEFLKVYREANFRRPLVTHARNIGDLVEARKKMIAGHLGIIDPASEGGYKHRVSELWKQNAVPQPVIDSAMVLSEQEIGLLLVHAENLMNTFDRTSSVSPGHQAPVFLER